MVFVYGICALSYFSIFLVSKILMLMEIRCLLLKEDNYKNKTQDSMNNVFSFICLFILFKDTFSSSFTLF